jgi:type II secretory pathway component GspD/PulD (secretin)
MRTERKRTVSTACLICLLGVLGLFPQPHLRAEEETISYLNLDNADVQSVLRYLSEVSGINIIADHDVKGEVSLHLENVTWRRALDAVVASQGLKSLEADGCIRVMTADTYYSERLQEHAQKKEQESVVELGRIVVKIENAKAEDVQKAVDNLLSDRGTIGIDLRTNSLIVADVPNRLPVIEETIRTLDARTPQVTIETKLVELNNRALKEIGIDWTAMTSAGDIIEFLGAKALTETTAVGQVIYSTLGHDVSLDAVLKVVETGNLGEIVGLPKITVVDHKEGVIFMGERVPLSTVDFSGNVIVRMEEVGTELTVTPHITEGNKILLELRPERSSVTEVVPGIGYRMSTQRAQTEVVVNDGDTVVIGGLRTTEETNLQKGLPILKEIPLLGHLFRYSRTEVQDKDLIIFVTPTIVRN